MKSLKFKTNITCDGCKSTVTPFLNSLDSVSNWDIDLKNQDKILTIESDKINPAEIINKLKEAGYSAQEISDNNEVTSCH